MKELTFEAFVERLEDYTDNLDEAEYEFFCDQGGEPFDTIQEMMGLLLINPPENWEDACTPVNSVTFARTGNSRVHFSFLELRDSSIAPVVMTSPFAKTKNVILGESLREFLSLGMINSFFSLEELAADKESTILALTEAQKTNRASSDGNEEVEASFPNALIKKLKLKAWKNIGKRLGELEKLYLSQIILPGEKT